MTNQQPKRKYSNRWDYLKAFGEGKPDILCTDLGEWAVGRHLDGTPVFIFAQEKAARWAGSVGWMTLREVCGHATRPTATAAFSHLEEDKRDEIRRIVVVGRTLFKRDEDEPEQEEEEAPRARPAVIRGTGEWRSEWKPRRPLERYEVVPTPLGSYTGRARRPVTASHPVSSGDSDAWRAGLLEAVGVVPFSLWFRVTSTP